MIARIFAAPTLCLAVVAAAACSPAAPEKPHRTFGSPEAGVKALADVVKAGDLAELMLIFGPGSEELIDSSDPATARHNREIFAAAIAEGWRLDDAGADVKTLVIGNEDWPFPVPLVKGANGWHFDAAAGMDEVLARRIGRNELAAIRLCRTYVAAQRQYAAQGHDGNAAGAYATTFRSDPGRQNGLYWPAQRGQKRSPLGDLVAEAEEEGRPIGPDARREPSPFHGYYFRILTGQGSAAAGGAKPYIVNGRMSGGFALVAWPARYDATGIMTFVVNQDGVVHEQDLGPGTDQIARTMTVYNPDESWSRVQPGNLTHAAQR
jgi:hypothetical protein